MVIGGEARAAVSDAAAARLACLASGGALIPASYAAWEEVTAGIAPVGLPGLGSGAFMGTCRADDRAKRESEELEVLTVGSRRMPLSRSRQLLVGG